MYGFYMVVIIPTTIACVLSLQARDPIPAFRKFALEEGLMSDADVKDIEKEIVAEVEEAVKFADESPKPVRAACQRHAVLA